MSPVNPMPQDAPRPKGVGRKGTAALPKAAEVCEVIQPPSVPTTPTWRSIADAAPGERSSKHMREPALQSFLSPHLAGCSTKCLCVHDHDLQTESSMHPCIRRAQAI